MRGTSSTSFAEVLRQAEAAFAAETGSLETVAEELFSVADAIDSSNQLVRLLSDAGRPAEVKQSAVRSLLADASRLPRWRLPSTSFVTTGPSRRTSSTPSSCSG